MTMAATALPNRASQVRSVPVTSPDEVTIARAAEMSGLIPAFIEVLAESQQIPSRFDGVNVVVRLADLEVYRMMTETELRHRVLDEIVAESQRMGLYQ